MARSWLVAAALLCLPAALEAQCADGSQPPCNERAPTTPLIAVLRFENLTPDSSEAYLASGLNEELIRLLAATPGLRTASRFQTRRFGTGADHDPASIAQALDATFLLTGSIQRIGATMRVGVELTQAPKFTLVLSDRIDMRANDIAGILDEVALRVAQKALGRIQARQRTAARDAGVPTEALQHFLRGSFLTDARGSSLVLAMAEFSRAIVLAPSFGRAWARRAYLHSLLIDQNRTYDGLPRDSLIARGLASLAEARRLAPNESDTWMADAYLRKQRYPQTFDGAVESFARAIALDPANAEAHHQFASVLALLERDSASESEYHRALRLDPTRAVSLWELGRFHHVRGRLKEALIWYDSAAQFERSLPVFNTLRAQLSLGDTAGARRTYQVLQGIRASEGLSEAPVLRALFLAGMRDTAEARQLAMTVDSVLVQHELERRAGPSFIVAAAFATLGMNERALSVIARSTFRNLVSLRELRFPEFDALRTDPRYLRFERDARGLP